MLNDMVILFNIRLQNVCNELQQGIWEHQTYGCDI